jgi:cell wall integrity and stress response component
MPSILRSGLVASIFTLFATSVSAQGAASVPAPSATNSPKAVQTLGCYTSLDNTFVDQGSYTYQTSGYCQILCTNQFKNVMATSQGSNCWCGDHIPAQSASTSNSSCNSPCNGYDQEDCGGDSTYTVYLSGLSTDVDVDGSSSSSAKATPTSNGGSSSSNGSPSVVTKAGQTIVVTASSAAGNQSGGTSKVGIAVGVVVGVLAIAGIIGGLIFFMKQRRKKAVEDEHKRMVANTEFLRQKSGKSETSSTTDNRLDQAATFTHRRQSIGSIADENDFSRRILQVGLLRTV